MISKNKIDMRIFYDNYMIDNFMLDISWHLLFILFYHEKEIFEKGYQYNIIALNFKLRDIKSIMNNKKAYKLIDIVLYSNSHFQHKFFRLI